MEKKRLTPPDYKNYEYTYNQSYQLACERLAEIVNLEQQCHKSGAQYQVQDDKQVIIIRYLNQSYQITLPDIKIALVNGAEEVPIRDRVLILHYFNSARGTPAAGRLITFRELPEGTVYAPTFDKRTVKHLLNNFGKEPELLLDTAKKLGGHQVEHGDVAVTIDAVARVPVTIVLWRGDEEFPPSGNILFDASITDYLATEDITILCETITWRLVRSFLRNCFSFRAGKERVSPYFQ